VRASDVVGRLGGDEFVVLLCGVGLEEAGRGRTGLRRRDRRRCRHLP
jgi:GGDEF domain-containing protein